MKHALLSLLFVGLISSTLVCCGPPEDQERNSGAVGWVFNDHVTATAHGVPAPTYQLMDVSGIKLELDEHNIVEVYDGQAVLFHGRQLGETYVILDTLPGYTYADIDTAYHQANYIYDIYYYTEPEDPWLYASRFGLIDQDLTNGLKRYVIIAHEENGVKSYQVFTVLFNPPEQ